jgi:hypothetical protein
MPLPRRHLVDQAGQPGDLQQAPVAAGRENALQVVRRDGDLDARAGQQRQRRQPARTGAVGRAPGEVEVGAGQGDDRDPGSKSSPAVAPGTFERSGSPCVSSSMRPGATRRHSSRRAGSMPRRVEGSVFMPGA